MEASPFQSIWAGNAFVQHHDNTMLVYSAAQEKVAELRAEGNIAAVVEGSGGDIYTFGDAGEALLWDLQAKSCRRLYGPTTDIKRATYLKQWDVAVSFGMEGEVFTFTSEKAIPLYGLKQDVDGVLWVDAWQQLVAWGGSPPGEYCPGRSEACAFSKPHGSGLPLLGLERYVCGVAWVDAWKALVAYGEEGAVVFEALEIPGQKLQDLTCTVKGVTWVEKWKVLLAYGERVRGPDEDRYYYGEAVTFKAPGGPGQPLAGLTCRVESAIWVGAWNGLLTLGSDSTMGDGEAVVFKAPDGPGRKLEGMESVVNGAIWVDAWKALVVYASKSVAAFREPDDGGWPLEGMSQCNKSAVWVDAWQALVVYCNEEWNDAVGEAVSFPALHAECQWLQGMEGPIVGARWVDQWGKLVLHGKGSLVAFAQLPAAQGLEGSLQQALWVDKWEALVVIDSKGKGVAFKAGGKQVQLSSPDHSLESMVWVEAWQALIAHGNNGAVVFAELGVPGKPLKGLDDDNLRGFYWVEAWRELAAQGEKGIVTFSSPDAQPQRLGDLAAGGGALVWVDAWQVLVSCGSMGVFALSKQQECQLDFMREEWERAEGAVWVRAWQALVVFGRGAGSKAELRTFSRPDQEGQRLGARAAVDGAVWVDKWDALVAYGWAYDTGGIDGGLQGAGAAAFTLNGRRKDALRAVSDMFVRGVVYAEDLGMLIVYGERAAMAFPTITHAGISLLPEDGSLVGNVTEVLCVSSGVAIVAGKDLWLIKPGCGGDLASYLVRHDAPVMGVVVRQGAKPTQLVGSQGAEKACELISLCDGGIESAMFTDMTLFASGFVGRAPYKKSISGKKLDLPKRYALDMALLSFGSQGASVLVGIGQLLAFAFHGVEQPKALQAPAQLLQRLQDFGVTAEVLSAANSVFLGLGYMVTIVLLLTFIFQEAIERRAFLRPKQAIWPLMLDGAGIGIGLVAGPVFLPLLKILIWPLAAASSDLAAWPILLVRLLSLLLSTALVLVCYRFVRVDKQLRRIDAAGWRLFTWRHDRVPEESDRLASRAHPLSLNSTWHGRVKIIAKVLMIQGQGATGVAPLAAAAFRVIVGFALAANDVLLDEYFPGPGVDWNRCATAASSGLAAFYCASFATVLVGKWPHGTETCAVPLILLNALAVPAAAAGYLFRPALRRAHLCADADGPLTRPLLGSEP